MTSSAASSTSTTSPPEDLFRQRERISCPLSAARPQAAGTSRPRCPRSSCYRQPCAPESPGIEYLDPSGNPQLTGRPKVTQRVELQAARSDGYTLTELVDAPGLRYEELDGEAEILPGVLVVPTPGHTVGHQSLVVRADDGTVVVAGQSHDTATAYSGDALAWRAAQASRDATLPPTPEWIDRLQRLDPRRVVFAHDHAVWTS